MTSSSSTIVCDQIAIKAPAAKIFAALTEPDQLVQWWGDENTYQCTHMERDLRVGGTWRVDGHSSDGYPVSVEGRYLVIDPPHVLEYTWTYSWNDGNDAQETIVRIELEERGGETLVRITHSGFIDPAAKASHEEGWVQVMNWLRAYVE